MAVTSGRHDCWRRYTLVRDDPTTIAADDLCVVFRASRAGANMYSTQPVVAACGMWPAGTLHLSRSEEKVYCNSVLKTFRCERL